MTLSVAMVVLAAAFFHAAWNTIVKAQPNQFAGYVVLLSVVSFLSLLGCFYYGAPPGESWLYLAISISLHLAYNYLLVLCYRLADISMVYPILRGAAPPLAALAGFFWLAELPSLAIIAGIVTVSAGIFCMIGNFQENGKAFAAALLTAVVIASYSVVDAQGARVTGNTIQYLCWLSVFDAPLFILLMLAGRNNRSRPVSSLLSGLQWRHLLLSCIGGGLTLLAYGLVIYAYTVAQVGAVAALRETSVVFGVLAGRFFLGEAKSYKRIIGSIVITIGVAVIVVNSE